MISTDLGSRLQAKFALIVDSDFQKSVWNAIINVSYGKTSSYLELAKNIGN